MYLIEIVGQRADKLGVRYKAGRTGTNPRTVSQRLIIRSLYAYKNEPVARIVEIATTDRLFIIQPWRSHRHVRIE